MPQTFSAADAVELALVERSGFVESRHVGVAVVLAPDGTVRDRLGDVDAPVLPRSTLKPLQALAFLAAGAPLDGFALSDCQPLRGDKIEQAVEWKGGSDISRLAGKPIRLRFNVRSADLFSFQFRQ